MQGRGRNFGDNSPNLGSARSDYGDRAYGGRLNEQGMERGWWDRATDEVSSWFGGDDYDDRNRMRSQWGDRGRGSYGRDQRFGGSVARGAGDWRDLRAADVMTRGVVTVHPDDSIQYAARMMGDCDCGAIPVVDWQGRMLGMVTDRDITIRLVANGADPLRARVDDCMTDEVFACHVGDPLEKCMQTMARHRVRRVPVLDDRNRVVGIVSQADIAQHASEHRGERRAMTRMIDEISEPTPGSYS